MPLYVSCMLISAMLRLSVIDTGSGRSTLPEKFATKNGFEVDGWDPSPNQDGDRSHLDVTLGLRSAGQFSGCRN